MEKELNDILEKQKQLRLMEKSLYDFAEGLKRQQDEFLINRLGFSKDEKNISTFEMLKRMADNKSRLIL